MGVLIAVRCPQISADVIKNGKIPLAYNGIVVWTMWSVLPNLRPRLNHPGRKREVDNRRWRSTAVEYRTLLRYCVSDPATVIRVLKNRAAGTSQSENFYSSWKPEEVEVGNCTGEVNQELEAVIERVWAEWNGLSAIRAIEMALAYDHRTGQGSLYIWSPSGWSFPYNSRSWARAVWN